MSYFSWSSIITGLQEGSKALIIKSWLLNKKYNQYLISRVFCDNKPTNLNTLQQCIFISCSQVCRLAGLYWARMGSAGLGSVVLFHGLFTQGLGSRSNPCSGHAVYGREIMLRQWEEVRSTSWSLSLNHHSGPSTTFCWSKHVTQPSPMSLRQRLYSVHREAILKKEVNNSEEIMPPFIVLTLLSKRHLAFRSPYIHTRVIVFSCTR